MGQEITFSVKIKEEDLFRYNIHHAYTSTQGIFSIILFVLLVAVWILRFSVLSPIYRIAYPLVAIIFLLYIPMTLKMRAKAQMGQEVFLHPLTYRLTDTGIVVSSPVSDEDSELPWKYIYKIATWKDYLLIYSNRINAYIIPKEDIANQYEDAVAYIKTHVEDFKLQIK